MSLIDEALKRARLEAAQKAAEGEGLPYPTIPRHLAPRRRPVWLAAGIVALAVIAGVIVGLLLASGGEPVTEQAAASAAPDVASAATIEPPPAAIEPVPAAVDPASDAAEPPPAVVTEPRSPRREPSSAAVERREPVAQEPISLPSAEPATVAGEPAPQEPPPAGAPPAGTATRPEETPSSDTPAAEIEPPPPPASMPAAEPQAPTTPVEQPSQATPPAAGDSPAATATTVTDLESGVLLVLPERVAEPADEPPTDSFVQQFPLPDGGSIELGGVAWSETGPFALINGRVVSPGSVVEEYTVERIGPTHVILSGDGRRVRISLQ